MLITDSRGGVETKRKINFLFHKRVILKGFRFTMSEMDATWLTPDIVCFISSFLDVTDVLNLELVCKTLRQKLNTPEFWRLFVSGKFPDVPLRGIKTQDVNWKDMAMKNSEDFIRRRLQSQHLVYRLAAPQNQRDFLRFFCRITTKGRKKFEDLAGRVQEKEVCVPDITLCCSQALKQLPRNVNQYWVDMVFAHPKQQSFLFWQGYSGISSTIELYAIDHQVPGYRVPLFDEDWVDGEDEDESFGVHFVWSPYRLEETLIGKSQYEEIGRVAHNDTKFFINDNAGRSYNKTTSHSSMRNTWTRGPLVSSSSLSRYTQVNGVNAIKNVTFRMHFARLFKLFLQA